jgi:hypothetical protein
VYSTLTDLAKFDQALNGNKLLSDASKKQMVTPYLKDYGWVIDSVSGRQRINPSGAINGFKANFIILPQHDLTITILYNEPEINNFKYLLYRCLRGIMLADGTILAFMGL